MSTATASRPRGEGPRDGDRPPRGESIRGRGGRGGRGRGAGRGSPTYRQPISVPGLDENEYLEREKAEFAEIDRLTGQMRELSEAIAQRSVGREEFERQRAEHRAKLDDLQKRIEAAEGDRKKLLEEIDTRTKAQRETRNEVQSMKKALGFSSEQEIDEEISRIEDRMISNSFSLKEEKKLLVQIAQLRKSKPAFGKAAELERTAAEEDGSVQPLRIRMDTCRGELGKLRDQKREQFDKFRVLQEERNTAAAPVKALDEQRDTLRRELNTHHQKRSEIKNELLEKRKQFSAQIAQEKARRDALFRAEKRRKQLAQDIEDVENELKYLDADPITGQLERVEKALAYVRQMSQSTELKELSPQGDSEPVKKTAASGSFGEDVQVVLPKREREVEYFYAPTASKTKKEKKKEKKKGSLGAVQDLRVLQAFSALNIAPPLLAEDVDNTIKELEARSSDLTSQRDKLEEGRQAVKKSLETKIADLKQQLADLDKPEGEKSPPPKARTPPAGSEVEEGADS